MFIAHESSNMRALTLFNPGSKFIEVTFNVRNYFLEKADKGIRRSSGSVG